MQKSENEIIQNCQNGNTEDFGLLYDLYVKKIYSYFFFRTFSKETSEDLTSLCFTKAFEKIHQVNSQKGAFRSWLYQIAKNILVDHFRSTKPTSELSEAEYIQTKDNPATQTHYILEIEKILNLLKQLPQEQQEILKLRIWEDLPYQEIAEITGKSEVACKTLVSRTLNKWRETLTILFLIILTKLI